MTEEKRDLINLKIAISPEKYIQELLNENQQLKEQLDNYQNKYNNRLNNQLVEGLEPDLEDYYLAEIEDKANKYDKLEKDNNRLLELCMYALISSTKIYNHELATDTKQAFIDIIKNNLNNDTYTLREKIQFQWEHM